MSGNTNEELSSKLSLFAAQSSEAPRKELYSIYLCYFDEARGHICLFRFPDSVRSPPSQVIDYHPIWFIDAEGRIEKPGKLDFEQHLKAGTPDIKRHFFPVQGPGLNQVELEYQGAVYLAAKFAGISSRKKKRAGLTEETPETYVLIVEVPSALRFLGAEILTKLHEEIMDKYEERLCCLIDREYITNKPVKSKKDLETLDLCTNLEGDLSTSCQMTLSKMSLDILHGKIKDHLDRQEQMTASLIGDLIRAGVLAERQVELVSNGPETSYTTQKGQIPRKIDGKSKELQMTQVELFDKDNALKINVRNNSESYLRNVDGKLIYQTEFFETHSWGTFIPFWPSKEELHFCCQRVPDDETGTYVFHLDDPDEKLLIRKIKISDIRKNPH